MRIYRSFATVGGLTLLSRVLGFIRDILIAAALGSGAVADAFIVAFRLPNLFRRLFGEGAFNAAFVPLFARRLEAEGPERAGVFAGQAASGMLLVLVLLSVACIGAMPWLMYLMAPGFADTPDKFDLAVALSQVTFPYLACMSLVALLSGVLNSLGRFVASSAVSIVLNVTLIAAILLAFALGRGEDRAAGTILAWGVFTAGLLQLAMLVWGASRSGVRLPLPWPVWNADMRRLVVLGIPGIIAGGTTQLNIVIGTVIASLSDGAVSHLYYADRIYELPLALVGIAIGVVLLPDLARHLRAGDEQAAVESQNRGLELAMFLTIPAAVAIAVIATPIVRVLFERGAFGPADTTATAAALAIFGLGLPAFVAIKVFSPAYFAREDTRTPMRFAGLSLVANTLGSVAFFFLFRDIGWMPHLGIAVATTLGGWVNALLLLAGLRRRRHFAMDERVRRVLPLIVMASVMMGLVLWVSMTYLDGYFGAENGLTVRASALAVLIVSGLIVYVASAFAFGALSWRVLVAAFRRQE